MLRASLLRSNRKLVVAFFLALGCILAQDPTTLLTPGVARVGDKLACRCGVCRNTVATCPMLHCEFSEPMRARLKTMLDSGMSDTRILNTIVKEQGVVALAAPPATGWGLLTWVMPGLALLIGFSIYTWWVRRNRQQEPKKVSEVDRATLDRFRDQIEAELEEPDDIRGSGRSGAK